MTERQLSLLGDARLSEPARILGFYLSTLPEGPHALRHRDLAVLLHKTPSDASVGRYMRELVVRGFVLLVSSGGRGSPVYEFVPASAPQESRAEKTLVHTEVDQSPSGLHRSGPEAPPTTTTGLSTTTTPPMVPREADGLDDLREYVGDIAVETALTSGNLPVVKLKGIMGMYGPRGMETERVFTGVSPPDRSRTLATAITRFALDNQKYSNRLFESFLTRARDGTYEKRAARRGTGTDGPGETRSPAASTSGANRGQNFIVE